ncbi:MAG: restriction endonuclease subunit S [Oscillospiraceae bacterium]|nr:restriction endonuclease subunit S [Oscillospiraceae bacterium]
MKCEWRPLGTLTSRKIGYGIVQPGPSVSDGIPVIKVNDIISGLKSIKELDTTTPQNDSKYSKTRLYGGELVISVVGTIGKTVIIPQPFAGCNLVRATALIDIKCEWLTKWVKYYLDSPLGQSYINQNLNTTVQPTLNIKSLVDMPIPFFEESIMKKTVKILAALDDKIELNQKINENLERQAQAIYSERFSGFSANDLTDGWKAVRLGDVAIISNKSFNPIKEPETLLEHYSIPAFDESRFPVFELSTSIKSNKFIIDADCFMISKLNPTTKRVWKPYCISDKAVCSTEFIVYKAREQQYTDFLYSLIDSESFSDFMCSHVTGSTGSRQRTAPSDTLQFEFALPPAEEISAFTAIVQPMYQQIRVNTIENDKLKRIRDTLLPKLMSGEIKVFQG